MRVIPVDNHNNLFQVQDLVPESLLDKINSTTWLDLPHSVTEQQQNFVRKNIVDEQLMWNNEWRDSLYLLMTTFCQQTNIKLRPWHKTNWWIDEPGFCCPIHLDEPRVKVGLQMFWSGNKNLGTTFYNSNNLQDVRKNFEFIPNSGYITFNQSNTWHAMMEPIPKDTFRLTSFTWFDPVK